MPGRLYPGSSYPGKEQFASVYSFTAIAASFVESGVAANLLHNSILAAATGTYTLTGLADSLKVGRTVLATTATFTVTGVSDNLLKGSRLAAGTGVFTVTGVNANLLKGFTLAASTVAFSLSGKPAAFLRTYVLTSSTGSFNVTGQAAGLYLGHKLLETSVGSFNLTGVNANLGVTRLVAVDTGIFSLNGIDATFTYDTGSTYTLHAETGVFLVADDETEFVAPEPVIPALVGTGGMGSGGGRAGQPIPLPWLLEKKRWPVKSKAKPGKAESVQLSDSQKTDEEIVLIESLF